MPFVFLFLGRTIRIAGLTLFFIPAFTLHKLFARQAGPRLLRWYLQSCGAGFVKLGQILAMRYDLLPLQYCDELSKLLDRLPPVPVKHIIRVIERDLGQPLTANFAAFEPVSLASASVAQVHGATLVNGESVVVKVLRPGMRERFRIDLIYLRLLGSILHLYGPFANIDVRRIFGEVVNITHEELDFRRESRNVQQMHERMAEDDIDHYAPRVYPALCGRSVITMERIAGVPVNEMLAAIAARDEEQLLIWAAAGITPQRAARILMRSILEQSLRHRLFHADPHAANLILMEGGTLAWVDFGMVGWLDERMWEHQFKIREAAAAGRIHAAYQHLLATLEPIPTTDLSNFEREAKEYFRDWLVSSESNITSLAEKSSGYFFLRLLDAVRRAGLSLPAGLVRLYRTIIIGDIVMLKLDPRINWLPVLREFIADERQRLMTTLCAEALSPTTFNTVWQAYVAAPRAALELLDWVQYRLAALGRTHRQQLTRWQRVFLLLLRYLKWVSVLALLALLLSRLVAPDFFANIGWNQLDATVKQSWGLLMVTALVLLLLCGRLIQAVERPEPR